MKILLTPDVLDVLTSELRRAGRRETGGLLMGEHVVDDVFRVVELTIQPHRGTHSSFLRDPAAHHDALAAFFARTGHNYTRYNYLGEWHSHPDFVAIPSAKDIITMQSTVEDPDVGVNFLVLFIARLSWRRRLEASATAFRPYAVPVGVEIDKEQGATSLQSFALPAWLSKIVGRFWRGEPVPR